MLGLLPFKHSGWINGQVLGISGGYGMVQGQAMRRTQSIAAICKLATTLDRARPAVPQTRGIGKPRHSH